MHKLNQQVKLYLSLAIISVIILVSFALIFSGVYQVYFAPATLFPDYAAPARPVEEEFGAQAINVVLLGLHNRNDDNTFGDLYYVDTILVASVNFDRNSLALLAIPRDSYIRIAGSDKYDRIRQAYSYGYNSDPANPHPAGLTTTLETVGSLLDGIVLQYYIAMDIQGLKQLIDSMGGVYYTVEKEMIGFTPRESLQAGPQLLDGHGYMTYLTYREADARDDLNRVKRQKALLRATFAYFKEMGLFSYVLPTYTAYRDNIRTNLTFNQVAALALFAAERLESNAISDYSLQGQYFSLDNGVTFLLALDQEANQKLIEKWSGR